MIESSNIQGVWKIENPDRGETLPESSSRLITGGVVTLNAKDQKATWDFECRDSNGDAHREKFLGKFLINRDESIELRFIDGAYAIFRLDTETRLVRIAYSGPTFETSLVMNKVARVSKSVKKDN
jgi:hypothetical protein